MNRCLDCSRAIWSLRTRCLRCQEAHARRLKRQRNQTASKPAIRDFPAPIIEARYQRARYIQFLVRNGVRVA